MFDSEPDHDFAILATTDLDIEPLFLNDPHPNPQIRGYTELELLTACEKQIAFLQAMQLRALARFAALRPGKDGRDLSEFAADEIALAAGWTRGLAWLRLDLARTLTARLPGTLAAMAAGHIDLRRAQKLAEITDPLTADLARQVENAVLPDAAEQNTSELARAARKAVARLDPEGAKARHQAAKQERRVEYTPLPDAMAELRAILNAADATHINNRLDALASAAATPGDTRTRHQRRADVLTDLLLGNHTTNTTTTTKIIIQVTVPFTTLMGIDDQPGDLAGYGPIPADVARDLAANGTWKRLLFDRRDGSLLDYGTTTYRPPANLANFVRARDHHCIFPGCARRADACDIDHRKRYPDGPTSEENLESLCGHHHRLKHEGGWNLDKRGDTYHWTSPTGHHYRRRTEPIAVPQPTAPPQPPAPPAPRKPKANDEPPPF